MRELQVLGDGHLKLDFAEWKDFFEQELAEQVRAQRKALVEKALEAERDRYLQFGFYEHAPHFRFDYRNGCYFRDFATRLGLLRGLRIPRTRKGFSSQTCLVISAASKPSTNWCARPFCAAFPRVRWAKCWNRCWEKPIRRKPFRTSRASWIMPCDSFITARSGMIISI